jgi:hypothetical protein
VIIGDIGKDRTAPLRKRLALAGGTLVTLGERNYERLFPNKETAQRWRDILDDLQCGAEPQLAGEGPVDATCRSLLDDDATKLAERILALFRDVVCLTVPRPD